VQYDRRTVLRGAAIGVLGASAGCLDGVTGGNEEGAPTTASGGAGTETTSGNAGTGTTAEPGTETGDETETTAATSTTGTSTTAESTTTPTCGDGLRRLRIDFPENYELAYREGFDFELTDPGDQSAGDSFTISLRNTTDEPQTTGPKAKYAIERRIEDGWRHVLQVPEGYTPPQGQVTHQPGDGFTWRFSADQEGFSVGPYTVCAPLQAGEYHFTYWGFPEAMRGLTIGFDIE